MVRCKDGRKQVLVKGYTRKDKKRVATHERNCPRPKSPEEPVYCCVCGDLCDEDCFQEFQINQETKTICDECVDTIHGLL